MDGHCNRAAMFRKKKVAMEVLRVKEPGKQFSFFEYVEYTTWPQEITLFLIVILKLESVQVLNGPMIDFSDLDSRPEFNDYFYANDIVDLLVPSDVPAHGWKLRPSNV